MNVDAPRSGRDPKVAELIQIGAYRQGGDPLIDEAVRRKPALEALLAQGIDERGDAAAAFARLAEALGAADGEGG